MKRFISLLLSLCMLLSITTGLDLTAYAADCGPNAWSSFDSNTGELTINGSGCISKPINVGFEDWIEPFSYNDKIKTVIIEEGITEIGIEQWGGHYRGVFEGCRNLTSVILPDSVVYIGYSAFAGCESLTNITIPDGLTDIGESAFSECISLTNIIIPDSVISIGYGAFYGCTNLAIHFMNPACDDISSCLDDADCSLIRGCSNSTAKEYARLHNVNFEAVDYWDNGEISTEPTCNKEGIKTYTCSVCGATKTESIPQTTHNPVIDKRIEPTCTSTGLTEGSHCSWCNAILFKQKVLSATSHSWDNGTVSIKPSCTKEGKMTHTCVDCGKISTETISSTGHNLLETVDPNEPYKKIVTCSNSNPAVIEFIDKELDSSLYPESDHPYANFEEKHIFFLIRMLLSIKSGFQMQQN